jgi:hypothetical protein
MQLGHAENVVTIPVEALVLSGSQETVYLLDASNHIRTRNVEVGLRGSKLAEIKSGLEAGDRVILGAQDKYSEGQQVSPIPTPEPASDVMREAGGVIDMKAEEENSGGAK